MNRNNMVKFQNTLIIVILFASCAQKNIEKSITPPVRNVNEIVFIVASSSTSQRLSKVKVSLITEEGKEIDLGETDNFGTIRVQKEFLLSNKAKMIIFSKERFFSGAIQYDGVLEIIDFDERYIELAPLALI